MSPVLQGLRVIELGSIGPGPHAAMVLADLGADVVRIERPVSGVTLIAPEKDVVLRNRRSVAADLKNDAGRELVLSLVERADVLVEGFRPGVTERLGVGPDVCLARNPRLVYGRMTGWGQIGPLASAAGHDINYLALSGALSATAQPGQRPMPPLNLLADLGGGSMLLVIGILAALLERVQSGVGQVVDAAMIDGVSTLMTTYWSLTEQGSWLGAPGTNVTDGGSPFYNTYVCRDGRYVAVGAVEPAFYRTLVAGLGLDPDELPDQMDESSWTELKQRFADIFATRTRDEWADAFGSVDACVTPVLELGEVAHHPHIKARGTIVSINGVRQPMPSPRFSRSEPPTIRPPVKTGGDRAQVLLDWGVEPQ